MQMILSFPLWWPASRSFPLVPAFDFLPLSFAGSLSFIPATGFAILLTIGVFRPGRRIIIFGSLAFAALLVLEDISRLQVWSYQLIFMLLIIASGNKGNEEATLANLRLVLISIYLWSGFNKLGVYYIEDSFPWMMESIAFLQPLGKFSFLAITSALLQIGLGLGLIFSKTRKAIFYVAVLLHLFILLALGPLGHDWNQVVWPWNICWILLLYFLFFKDHFFYKSLVNMTRPISYLTFALFALLPALNIVHLWPDQLSFKMYSGAYSEGVIFAKAVDGSCFPDREDVYTSHSLQGDAEQSLIIDNWAMSEMGVTPFVNEGFYLRFGMRYCACLEDMDGAGVELLTAHRWNREAEEYKRLTCKDLLQIEK